MGLRGWVCAAFFAVAAAAAAVAARRAWTWALVEFAPQFEPYILLQMANSYIPRSNPPFPDKAYYFPDAHILEEHWEEIAAEWHAVVKRLGGESKLPEYPDIDPLQGTITRNNAWRMVMMHVLWADTKNAAYFPRTMELLRQCRGIRNAFFSVLEPGTELTPHMGPMNSQIRYHLGIDVKQPEKCTLFVDGIERHWKEGEGFVWDDIYVHSAANHGTTPRVVLFLDIDRRDISWTGKIIDYILVKLFRSQPYFEIGLHAAQLNKND